MNIGLIIRNKETKSNINYVVSLYAIGSKFLNANLNEDRDLLFDTTTKTIHVATVINGRTIYTTKSSRSQSTTLVKSQPTSKANDDGKWKTFFRVNISYKTF